MGKKRILTNDTSEEFYIVDGKGNYYATLETGDTILRKDSEEFLESTEIFQKGSTFTKLFDEGVKNLPESLKVSDFRIMLTLACHIEFFTGMLYKRGQFKLPVPLTLEDMVIITGVSKRALIAALGRLVTEKVLARTKCGRIYLYYANPYVFMKGKRINKTLISMFKNYKYK